MTEAPLRIAMWSGPRNMSTTMMRSFGARSDCLCVDEPFYAAYLKATGLRHPMSDEIFASQSSIPEEVIASLTGPIEPDASVHYQKHMTKFLRKKKRLEINRKWKKIFLMQL